VSTLRWSAQPDPLATQMNEQERAMAMQTVPSIVSLVLYLCSENAEIRNGGGDQRVPGYPKPKKTKKGLRIYAPDKPTHWEVGFRLGAALRRSAPGESEGVGGTHARPRPHIRRAHWHSYWVGKWDDPEARRVVLKWLPPIAVNLQHVDELTTTIRDVRNVIVTQVMG
jgi:hypothetical protein